jgi:uncharacterized membrane protein
MKGSVNLTNGHIDYIHECEVCGSENGVVREDDKVLCRKCYASEMESEVETE